MNPFISDLFGQAVTDLTLVVEHLRADNYIQTKHQQEIKLQLDFYI